MIEETAQVAAAENINELCYTITQEDKK